MVAGNGIAVRLLSFAAIGGSSWTLNYILQWAVVLNKVEVGGGYGAKRDAEIAHYGDSFQKNLWEQNGGAPV